MRKFLHASRLSMLILLMLCLTPLPGFAGRPALPFAPDQKTWQTVQLGQINQTPMTWRVITADDAHVTLLATHIVSGAKAHDALDTFTDYEHSALHATLQKDLLAALFPDVPGLDAALGEGALTLPSSDLVKNETLGFVGDSARKAPALPGQPLPKAYWLSTAATSNRHSLRVVKENGQIGNAAVTKEMGVRPLLRLPLSLITVDGGNGSKEQPFLASITQAHIDAMLAQQAAEEKEKQRQALAARAEIEKQKAKKEADKQALRQEIAALEAQLSQAPNDAALQSKLDEAKQAYRQLDSLEIEGFPTLTGEGFLEAGAPEFITADRENGLWRYASQDLRIEIIRQTTQPEKGQTLRYYKADIYVRDGADGFRMLPYNKEHMKETRDLYRTHQVDIARQHKAVLACNGDYFLYRLGRPGIPLGLIIRDGQVLIDDMPQKGKSTMPPLHLLALYPDGRMETYGHHETDANTLLQKGARDVLSFGPWLYRNGQINEEFRFGNVPEPRIAIGMVEKGHYIILSCEGRIKDSKGVTIRQLANMMKDFGCEMAFNLDGGLTNTLIFMGEQLNVLAGTPRTQNEVLGIGQSDAVPAPQPRKK